MTQDIEAKRLEELRKRADVAAKLRAVKVGDLSAVEHSELVHELQSHQIELELQNDELYKAQIGLSALQQSYADLYDTAPVGYVTLDSSGVITKVNLTLADMLGVERPVLLGKDFHDFLDRMDQDNFFLYFRKVTVEHLHSVIRLRIHSCNDRPVWVELSSTPMLVEGGCYGSQIVITDISQRIVMEQELITSHDYLNSLVDNLTVGVGILVGPDFRYSRVNATLAEMNGISIEGHFGKKFVEVLPHAAPSLMPELTHVFNTGKPSAQRDHCTRLPDQPDKDRWFLDSFFPIAVTEGQPKAVGYMSLEITERKNLEQEILDISEQERRRLGIEIHDDLGQLLTGIGFMAEELAQTLGKKGLKLEAERVNLMANLIADATKKARNLSQSFYPVELESVSFASTLTALALRTEEMYDVRCVVQIGEPIDILSKASILSLYHIVREAVSNAVRHASPTRIDINVTLERDLLLVSVKDDGSLKPQTLSRSEGIGRRIMQYRADLLSATLDSSHVAGRGTIVSCYMKLPYFPHSPSPEVNG